MRPLALLLASLLSASAFAGESAPGASEPGVVGTGALLPVTETVPEPEMPPCAFDSLIGQTIRKEESLEAVQQRFHLIQPNGKPYGVRLLYPNSAMTEDFSPSRVNFYLTPDGVISKVNCG